MCLSQILRFFLFNPLSLSFDVLFLFFRAHDRLFLLFCICSEHLMKIESHVSNLVFLRTKQHMSKKKHATPTCKGSVWKLFLLLMLFFCCCSCFFFFFFSLSLSFLIIIDINEAKKGANKNSDEQLLSFVFYSPVHDCVDWRQPTEKKTTQLRYRRDVNRLMIASVRFLLDWRFCPWDGRRSIMTRGNQR